MKYPVDDSIARNLQEGVHRGERQAMTLLYAELRHVAIILCKSFLQKRGQRMPEEKIAEVAHDAVTVLMTRYMKDRAYHVRNFRAALWLELLQVITGGRRKPVPAEEVSEAVAAQEHGGNGHEDPREYLHDLLGEHRCGSRVVFDLARSKTYPEAVRRIAEYTGRQWIRDRARKLVRVYETLRVEP